MQKLADLTYDKVMKQLCHKELQWENNQEIDYNITMKVYSEL